MKNKNRIVLLRGALEGTLQVIEFLTERVDALTRLTDILSGIDTPPHLMPSTKVKKAIGRIRPLLEEEE